MNLENIQLFQTLKTRGLQAVGHRRIPLDVAQDNCEGGLLARHQQANLIPIGDNAEAGQQVRMLQRPQAGHMLNLRIERRESDDLDLEASQEQPLWEGRVMLLACPARPKEVSSVAEEPRQPHEALCWRLSRGSSAACGSPLEPVAPSP